MGMSDPAFAEDDQTLIRAALAAGGAALEGITFEHLVDTGWARLRLPEEYLPYPPGAPLSTPSGRIQMEAPELAELGLDPLPAYVPPAESAAEGTGAFALTLLSPPEHALLNSTFANVGIGAARHSGTPEVLLHPDDATARGIGEAEPVRVWNERGGFDALARVSDGVRRGVAVSYGVRWARRSPGGETVNDTTSQSLTDLGGGAVFYDNAVEISRRAS
jgi:anaerobic selenocysteine-containing dehydrogenase